MVGLRRETRRHSTSFGLMLFKQDIFPDHGANSFVEQLTYQEMFFPKVQTFSKSVKLLSRKATHRYIDAICSQPESGSS